MNMHEGFLKAIEGCRITHDALGDIIDGLRAAQDGGRRLEETISTLNASNEALKESVDELKAMILDQGKEMKALKDRLNGH
jgi:hypothetical protein